MNTQRLYSDITKNVLYTADKYDGHVNHKKYSSNTLFRKRFQQQPRVVVHVIYVTRISYLYIKILIKYLHQLHGNW